MNRRHFLKCVAAATAAAAIPAPIAAWSEARLAQPQLPGTLTVVDANAVLSIFDDAGRVLAMGLLKAAGPATSGTIMFKDMVMDVLETGYASTYRIAGRDGVLVSGNLNDPNGLFFSNRCLLAVDQIYMSSVSLSFPPEQEPGQPDEG